MTGATHDPIGERAKEMRLVRCDKCGDEMPFGGPFWKLSLEKSFGFDRSDEEVTTEWLHFELCNVCSVEVRKDIVSKNLLWRSGHPSPTG